MVLGPVFVTCTLPLGHVIMLAMQMATCLALWITQCWKEQPNSQHVFLQHPTSKIPAQVIFIDSKHLWHSNHPNFLLFVILVIKFKTWFWSREQIWIWIATKKKSIHSWSVTRHTQICKNWQLTLQKYAYSRLQQQRFNCIDRGSNLS